jgi:glycine cleavage system regulatory protein
MRVTLVLTLIATDRPGLVDAIASVIGDHEGNWLESRMSRLGGQFAGILRVELPAGQQAALEAALRQLDAHGLHVAIQPGAPAGEPGSGELRILEVVGHDRPGIVRQISHALAQRGVNVEEFSSEVASAAMSGEPLFRARAKVRLPSGLDWDALQAELEGIAADLIVELSFIKPE